MISVTEFQVNASQFVTGFCSCYRITFRKPRIEHLHLRFGGPESVSLKRIRKRECTESLLFGICGSDFNGLRQMFLGLRVLALQVESRAGLEVCLVKIWGLLERLLVKRDGFVLFAVPAELDAALHEIGRAAGSWGFLGNRLL